MPRSSISLSSARASGCSMGWARRTWSPKVTPRRRAAAAARLPSELARAGQRRVAGEVALDAGGERTDQARLVLRIAQLAFLLGVRDEGRLDQDRRHVGRLQHGEAGLLDAALVQL